MKSDKWRDHDVLKLKILEGLPLEPKYGMPIMERVVEANVRNPIPFNSLSSTKKTQRTLVSFLY